MRLSDFLDIIGGHYNGASFFRKHVLTDSLCHLTFISGCFEQSCIFYLACSWSYLTILNENKSSSDISSSISFIIDLEHDRNKYETKLNKTLSIYDSKSKKRDDKTLYGCFIKFK